jgi:acyl-CoA hydrolase/RimJ/RimL family protein N-acetyltransferase
MPKYTSEIYKEKKMSLSKALSLIKSGQRIFIGSSCGEPQHLVNGLGNIAHNYTDLEILRVLSMESTPLTLIANKTKDTALNIRSFYTGSASSSLTLSQNKRFITPTNLSSIPMLFKTKKLPINVALIQVSPPDESGRMSLGISVDVTLAAAMSADKVIAQVNSEMPRTWGDTFINVEDVDAIVEYKEPLLIMYDQPELTTANIIAEHIARLIDDGSTLQICLGTLPKAILLALSDKNDLGIHTQYITNPVMNLIKDGVITNRQKKIHKWKSLACSAIGDKNLYKFLDNNPSIEFYPSDYIQNPAIIAQNYKMTSINIAVSMDLTGQVATDAFSFNNFCGDSILDFTRGAAMSKDGKPIIMITSTTKKGKQSRIVPMLNDVVVVPRSEVYYVVSEYGAVNLFGKSLQERAIAMISLAHPDFRDELFQQAKDIGLLNPKRTASKLLYGVYPVKLEESIKIDGVQVIIRPSKPVDERRIQEHFYNLDPNDVIARFFYKKKSFISEEIKDISQIDYKNNLTVLAIVGTFGFGKVVGIGEYYLNPDNNMAEVAFSISKKFQGKGLGKILIKKLMEGANHNNIKGFFAYTAFDNQGMIKLFKTLPCEVKTSHPDNSLLLEAIFEKQKTT